MLDGIRRYRKFPIFSSWAGILNTLSWQLPVLMFGMFFSPTVVGFYALGFRILQMPMSLVGSAIGQVFHQRAAEVYLQGSLAPLLEGLMKRLLMVILFPMLMLTVIGRDLYIVVFGQAWAEAGVYTQILSVWAIVWFVSSPLSTLYGVMGKQAQGLALQVAVFISRLVSIGVGAYYGSVTLSLILFSVSGFFVYGYMILQISKFADLDLFRTISGLTKCGALSLSLMLMILALKMVTDLPAAMIAAGVACSIVYFSMLRNDIWQRSLSITRG